MSAARRTPRLPPKVLRRLILSAGLGAGFAVAAWYLGMDVAHAVGLGAAAFAFTACLSALGEAADVSWAVPAPEPRAGARRDVVQLGWALGARGGRASPEGVRRVRIVAERALALYGLDLEDRSAEPDLERLIGRDVLAALRRGAAPPRTALIGVALTRLEALERAALDRGPASSSGPSAAASLPSPAPRSPRIPPPADAIEEPSRAR